jgi:putative polyhydroxyalkanoate system protein
MSHITHEIRHGLTLDQAKNVAHTALADYLARYASRGLSASWSSDTRAELQVAVRGVHIEATVDVQPDTLRVDAKVPLVLRAFKGAAITAIEREAKKWIDKAKAEPPTT